MAKIENAEKIYFRGATLTASEAEETTVTHEKGKVTLLNFWLPPHMAPKSDETPMALYQQMVEKNGEEWLSKVRLIGVSDHELEEI